MRGQQRTWVEDSGTVVAWERLLCGILLCDHQLRDASLGGQQRKEEVKLSVGVTWKLLEACFVVEQPVSAPDCPLQRRCTEAECYFRLVLASSRHTYQDPLYYEGSFV